jgi:hypothetical protein
VRRAVRRAAVLGHSGAYAQAPDLAARIADGEIDLAAAPKELDVREREETAVRDGVLLGIATLTNSACNFDKSERCNALRSCWRPRAAASMRPGC